MDREELLKWLDGRISNYYYEILYAWTKKREKEYFFFKRKFDVKPTLFEKGYIISSGLESLIVYKD